MASILPGYEYDIFISYRQNDNKRDKWVTQFVEALKDELEATLKNPVSIYFDENPHDGLLETHDVDRSLEKKLKCLIFIPIISQTFCDPGCFAWEHELLSFVQLAQADELGMNITLANGNVASRILPIRIHDIDADDTALFEKTIDGHMRSIDFIYKEAGVNRPLTAEDDKVRESGKTLYSNQINKVANALKEIGTAIIRIKQGHPPNQEDPQRRPISNFNSNSRRKQYSPYVLGALLIIVLSYVGYWAINTGDVESVEIKPTHKSIAVLPFRNDSNDPANIYFCNGLMEDIINQLAQNPNIKVPSVTSMLYYRDNPKPYPEIVKELGVSYLLEASVRKTTSQAIMNITLIDSKMNQSIWTDRMEMDLSVKDLFDIQFEVAKNVAAKMKIALDETKTKMPTNNYMAYDNFLKARDLLRFWDMSKNRTAINFLLKAITIDPDFQSAMAMLGQAYGQRSELSSGDNWVDSAQYYSRLAYNMNKNHAGSLFALGYAKVFKGDVNEALKLYLKGIEINPNAPFFNYAGWCYLQLGEFDKAIKMAAINIEADPKNSIFYIDMSNATQELGLFEHSEHFCQKALELNPEFIFALDDLQDLEMYKGNYAQSLKYLEHIIEITENPKDIAFQGIIYYKLDSVDKAADYLNINFEDSFDEKMDDENSKIELYKLLQYRALLKINAGLLSEGESDLQDILERIKVNLNDKRPSKYFYLACANATLGNSKEALRYLKKAADGGYNQYYSYIGNDLLEPIRNTKEYSDIIRIVEDRNSKMRENVFSGGYLKKL